MRSEAGAGGIECQASSDGAVAIVRRAPGRHRGQGLMAVRRALETGGCHSATAHTHARERCFLFRYTPLWRCGTVADSLYHLAGQQLRRATVHATVVVNRTGYCGRKH
jgi:hypothetical protein